VTNEIPSITFSQLMYLLLVRNWKSTATGALVSAVQIGQALMVHPHPPALFVTGVATALLGVIAKDRQAI
jgi:hypothetical protein